MSNHDPNSNRMFCDDMGACKRGCKCQMQFFVTVKGGEVENHDHIEGYPGHLRLLDEAITKGDVIEKDGSLWWKWELDEAPTGGWEPEPIEVVTVGDKRYYKEPCAVAEFDDFGFEGEAKHLPDGDYVVTQEKACWTEYVWDYNCYEGESESVFEVEKAEGDHA